MRFETPGGINLEEIFGQAQRPQRKDVRYEITISGEQAVRGVEKDLMRKGKKLRVKIPVGVKTGSKVRLRNARQVTNGEPGDIMIIVKVK
jgi:DnaJ-class molecular chaperone